MYQYTDASKPHESSITRYTLDKQGNVISETFYANWDAVIKKYEFQSW
jgi:YD repeat-containing protein